MSAPTDPEVFEALSSTNENAAPEFCERVAARADLREAVKLTCGCDCPKCVRVVSMLADEGLGWIRPASPCTLARPS